MPEFYIGLMSGTSLDGVDGVLADCSASGARVLQHVHRPFPAELAAELLVLNSPGDNELHRAALAANALNHVYAQVVEALLKAANLPATAISAIGAHGQTVRHRPGAYDGTGYTLQLNNPALLAELSGITVVADFRSRDVAAGGQGAPLVPAFHQALFGRSGQTVAVLNIGGIANLSVLRDDAVLGWDCGPGNALLDAWCRQHTGRPFDEQGRWAASGRVHAELLRVLLQEPYFALPAPKSSGRDLFNPAWLLSQRAGFETLPAVDVQATLTELTARVCAADVLRHAAGTRRLIVCGGGALNTHLMLRLQAHLSALEVMSSEQQGLPPLQVEAAAFAWLARKTLQRETGSLQSVTGARGARVLGAIYPA
ncbi:anhydro-N-acetylmuramic acid kinase [Curvibacter fontanus]